MHVGSYGTDDTQIDIFRLDAGVLYRLSGGFDGLVTRRLVDPRHTPPPDPRYRYDPLIRCIEKLLEIMVRENDLGEAVTDPRDLCAPVILSALYAQAPRPCS